MQRPKLIHRSLLSSPRKLLPLHGPFHCRHCLPWVLKLPLHFQGVLLEGGLEPADSKVKHPLHRFATMDLTSDRCSSSHRHEWRSFSALVAQNAMTRYARNTFSFSLEGAFCGSKCHLIDTLRAVLEEGSEKAQSSTISTKALKRC